MAFYFTQLYGLYHEIKEQFKVKYNLMNKIESLYVLANMFVLKFSIKV